MLYYFDPFGWLTSVALPGRSTEVEPPEATGNLRANWLGEEWALMEYVEPPVIEPPTPVQGSRKITLGALQKRLGVMNVFAIDNSSHPVCIAFRSYLSRLPHIDLDDPDLPKLLGMLVDAQQPEHNDYFPDSGPLTEEQAAEVIAAPVEPQEVP